MSKRPEIYTIEWHENNLNNLVSYHKREKNQLEIQKAKVEKISKEIAFLALQILEAKKQNKEKFDSDKFLKPKKSWVFRNKRYYNPMNEKNKEFLEENRLIKSFKLQNKIIDIWESDYSITICANGIELEPDNQIISYLNNEGFLDFLDFGHA
jgi:hypothetical protein